MAITEYGQMIEILFDLVKVEPFIVMNCVPQYRNFILVWTLDQKWKRGVTIVLHDLFQQESFGWHHLIRIDLTMGVS